MTSPRRNDPCSCGSGRKYKQCHGAPGKDAPPADELAWRRVRRAVEGYPTMMLRFIKEVYGPETIHEAWDAFTLWEDEEVAAEFDPETPHLQVFLPWFFHQWTPNPHETWVADLALHDRSATSVLLERRGRRLDPVLRRYLEACAATPLSFHEVLEVRPGASLRTREVFTGTEHEVLDRAASQTLKGGDLFFGQVVTAEGIGLLEAMGPCAIPPANKIPLIDLRARMGRQGVTSQSDLVEWDIEIRDLYLTLTQRIMDPPLPRFQNTDGEALIPHRLHFEIGSASRAFHALEYLSEGDTEDELLESAELDAEGQLQKVSLAWKRAGNAQFGSWDNTVLGHLDIDGGRLTAHVNSVERAARLREIIEEALGQDARHRATELEPVESALAERSEHPVAHPRSAAAGPSENPEIAELIREMMAAHYEDWVSQAVPALGGLAPLEAVRSRDGREKVGALVEQFERSGRNMTPPLDPAIIHRLRERLGLLASADG